MRNLNRSAAVMTVLLVSMLGMRNADALPLTSIGPFTGNLVEDWESFGIGSLSNGTNIMGGAASIRTWFEITSRFHPDSGMAR